MKERRWWDDALLGAGQRESRCDAAEGLNALDDSWRRVIIADSNLKERGASRIGQGPFAEKLICQYGDCEIMLK